MKKITYTSVSFRQKVFSGVCSVWKKSSLLCADRLFYLSRQLTGVTHQYKNWSQSLFAEYLSVISVKLGQFPEEIKTAIIKICMEINFYFDTEMVLRSSDLLVSKFVTCLRSVMLLIPRVLKWWQNWKCKSPAQPVPGNSCRWWKWLQGVLGWSI